MLNRRTALPLLTLVSASACTVMLPAAPTAEVADSRPVFVASGPAGKTPIIQSFTANPGNVTKGQPITFQVVAHDPNGEPLQYTWSATGGTLSATTGQALMWTPPDKPGVHTVMVTVTNGGGGITTGSQNLTVQSNGTAAIGGTPVLPSIAPTPAIVPTPSLMPSPIVSASPSPVATPTASSSGCPGVPLLPTYDDTYVGCYLHLTNLQQAQALKFPYPKITLRFHSPSLTRYVTRISVVTKTDVVEGVSMGGDVTTGDSDQPIQLSGYFKGVYLLSFTPRQLPVEPNPLDQYVPLLVQLRDCKLATFNIFKHAVPLARANWSNDAPATSDAPRYDKTVYIFKFDGQPMDLGTFDVP